ncbi:MAG TPA: hypothetical protein PKV05_04205, partial [Bacillota bacterium]|nr:hypothetical protein [Bacillota bacterium]
MSNFKLELTKILKSKKFFLLLLLCVLIPSAMFFQHYTNLDRYCNDLSDKMAGIRLDLIFIGRQYKDRMEE